MNKWMFAEIPKVITTLGKQYSSTTPIIESGDGHPIIVYPGFTTGNMSTKPLRNVLVRHGHDCIPWAHKRNNGISQQLLEKLSIQVDHTCQQYGCKVSIVGHSLGGTIGRVMANIHPSNIRRVITIGSPINNIGKSLNTLRPIYDRINGADATDQHWELYRDLVTRSPVVPCTSIYSTKDGMVKPSMSILDEPYGTNIEVDGGHFSMMIDPVVFSVVAKQLNQV